jgi:hypothetical protein
MMKRLAGFGLLLLLVPSVSAWAQSSSPEAMRVRIEQLSAMPKIEGSSEMAELRRLNEAYNSAQRETLGPPPNDSCASPIPLNCGDVLAFDTTGATTDGTWSCALGGAEIWYSITGNGGNITFETCGSAYDTAINTYTGACGGLVEQICNDDFCGLQSTVVLPSVNGTDYLVAIGGFNGGTGTGTLTVTCDIPAELTGFEVE